MLSGRAFTLFYNKLTELFDESGNGQTVVDNRLIKLKPSITLNMNRSIRERETSIK